MARSLLGHFGPGSCEALGGPMSCPTGKRVLVLLKQGDGFRQHFLQQFGGQGVDFSAVAGFDIENAGLVASHYSAGSNAGERDNKTDAAGEFSPVGNGQDNRQFGGVIERGGRDDEDWTMAVLFVTEGGIKRHSVNVSSFHSSSRPTAGASTHSRSSGGCGCE